MIYFGLFAWTLFVLLFEKLGKFFSKSSGHPVWTRLYSPKILKIVVRSFLRRKLDLIMEPKMTWVRFHKFTQKARSFHYIRQKGSLVTKHLSLLRAFVSCE